MGYDPAKHDRHSIRIQGYDYAGPDDAHGEACPARVRADGARPAVNGNATYAGATHAPLRRAPRSLSSFVAGFKAAVTARARRELEIATVWQRNFYEHMIRDEDDCNRIYNYIQSNPAAWGLEHVIHDPPC